MKQVISLFLLLGIASCAPTPVAPIADPADTGDPDLTMVAFVPPIILAGGGDTIYISESTSNIGDGASTEFVNRYYISATAPIDVSTAVVIGERAVPAISAGAADDSIELPFVIPESLGQGPHFLAACVDSDDDIAELNEKNNCTTDNSGDGQMLFDTGMTTQ